MAESVVVAIPARDEAERIKACLTALDQQIRRPDSVVLMLNNCTDDSAMVARSIAPNLRFQLELFQCVLPPERANAGSARRMAMQIAADQAGPNGFLLTTDADSIAPADWVSRNFAELRNGTDIVCGRAVIDPLEATSIPASLHADDALECRLIALLDDLAWHLDPERHDPPPRHTEASGASIAVSVPAYRRVGGIPAVPSGEDRTFVRNLWMIDAHVRHDPAIRVLVSGRIIGRADGGMADAIRRRMQQQDEYTDDQAEPVQDAFRRYKLRYRVRRLWAGAPDAALADALGISQTTLDAARSQPYFGSAWAMLEPRSPVLARRRVRFRDLPAQIAIAERLLREVAVRDTLAAD